MGKLILVFACIFNIFAKVPEHVQVSDSNVEAFASTIKSEQLLVLSVGGFYESKKVENLYLDLEYKGVLSQKIARGKLIKYVRGMLSHINADKKLQPFLTKDKFTSRDISLSLAYLDENKVSSQVHIYEGEIIFSTYDKMTNKLTKTHREPFSLN